MDTKLRKRESEPMGLAPFETTFGFPLFRRFAREIDDLFDRFGVEPHLFAPAETVWSPEVEMFQRGTELVVRADIPGLKKDDVTVEITDGQIMLQGERKQEKEEKKEGYYGTERTYGSFYRTLPLPEGVKSDQAKATIHNGVLEIVMPTTKAIEKKRRLEIQESATAEKTAKHAA